MNTDLKRQVYETNVIDQTSYAIDKLSIFRELSLWRRILSSFSFKSQTNEFEIMAAKMEEECWKIGFIGNISPQKYSDNLPKSFENDCFTRISDQKFPKYFCLLWCKEC